MITVSTDVLIKKKSPKEIYHYFLYLNKKKYIAMAPDAHKDFKVIKPVETVKGSIYFFHEIIGNLNLHHSWIVTQAKENEYIFQKAQFIYPVVIEIYLKKIPGGTKLIQNILIGFSFFGIEKIVDWFARIFILNNRQIALLHAHTNEEFSSLEKI